METSDTDSQEQAAGATTSEPSSSLAVHVSEEIAKNVGELAAETAIAFAMSRATSKEHPPKLDPGSGRSMRQKVPVKKPKGRPRKEPKKQLSVKITHVNRDKPTPEGKKLSSVAGSGEGKNDPPRAPQLLSGRQISRIMGQDPMEQIQTSAYEKGLDSGPSAQSLETTLDRPPILTSPVKRKRGRSKKVRELVQPVPPPLSMPSQPPTVANLPPSPELPTVNPEPISSSASESSDAKQLPFAELDGWPIAAIAVNDSAGNMQPAALIIMHPSDDSSQSAAKRPRGRPKKHPPVGRPVMPGGDTEAMYTDSGKASTAARLEDGDALPECKPETEMSVSEVAPPGDTAPVKRKRGRRPKKTPTTVPVVKRPRGRPKKPRPLVAPQQPLPSSGPQLVLSRQPLLLTQQFHPSLQPLVDPQTAHEGPRSTETSVDVSLSDKEEEPVPTATKILAVEEPKERLTLLQKSNVPGTDQATTAETADLHVAAASGESTVVPAKRKRGRPPKPKPLETLIKSKRPRGRPRKSSLLPQPPASPSQQTEPPFPTPIKRPRGRPPKHPNPAKLQGLVTAAATMMGDSSPAVPDKQPRSRSRKNPQPKQIRPNDATVAIRTHSAVVEISPPAMEPQVRAPPPANGEGDLDVMEAQVPDMPFPCPALSPVSDSEETAEGNSTDAPNIPLPFEILSKVRSVLPPEEATNGLVLQRAEPPTTACTVANGVHTVLSPVINVGRPRKRPHPQDLADSSLQTSEGESRTEEPLTTPVKRPRGRPPKKRQSLEQIPTTDSSVIPVKRRPGRPRKNPLPPPSFTEAGATSESKHEGTLLSTKQTSASDVNVPVKRPVGRPRKTPSLPAGDNAGKTLVPQPSQPPDVPATGGPRIILPKVGGQVPTPPIHGKIKVKKRPGRPRKRPLEPEPRSGKECSGASDGGLPVKKRRGRPPKKQPNETDETSSVCPPDVGTLTAQVKAVVTALPSESNTKDSSSKTSGAKNVSLMSDSSVERQGSSSNFQLRLSVSFSDSSDDMDTEGDTLTALQILTNRVKSDEDPKAEESEDDSSSSYVSTFD